MKPFTFWIVLLAELAYCGGAVRAVLDLLHISLTINPSSYSYLPDWCIALVLCGICALCTRMICRKKQMDAEKRKAYMQSGTLGSFGLVGTCAVLLFIALEPWGGYFG